MNINDETVTTFRAARDLVRLYDAYRSEIRAQILGLQQVMRHMARNGSTPTDSYRLEWSELERREAQAWNADRVFAIRREQIHRRLLDLQGLPERP